MVVATETTRSLNEFDGFTESSLIQSRSHAERVRQPVGAAERREPGAHVHSNT